MTLFFWQCILLSFLYEVFISLQKTFSASLSLPVPGFLEISAHTFIMVCCILSVAACITIRKISNNKNKRALLFLNPSQIKIIRIVAPILITATVMLAAWSSLPQQLSHFVWLGSLVIIAVALSSTSYKFFDALLRSIHQKPRNIFLHIRPDTIKRIAILLTGIIAARLISICALALYVSQNTPEETFIALEVVALALVFACKPEESYFYSKCPSCRAQRSLALEGFPKCPDCYPRKFYN